MRSVLFVEHLEFEFSGNILERAIALGDVNNDGGCELVVANISGDLAIFKGSDLEPWRRYHGLGMVSCVVIGDMCDVGRNAVFCITTEGWCHLMCFGEQVVCDDVDEPNATHGDVISTHHQPFPTNGKVALIADVDGDGTNELVIASTDRVVRVFKWVKDEGKKDVKTQEKKMLAEQSSKSSLKKYFSRDNDEDDKNESESESSTSSGIFNGKFVCVKRLKLAGQIESLSVIEGRNGTSPAILVSQPGGYIYLFCGEESLQESLHKQKKKLIPKSSTVSFTDCYSSVDNSRPQHPLPRRSEMSTVPTYAISWFHGSVRPSSASSNFIAMCTLNGNLSVIKDEKLSWSMTHNQNVFTVQRLDITDDGKDEVIFCSWSGETFIMDQYENIVNFKLGQDISAFCAGFYSRDPGVAKPCLVYVMFNNRIRLYWNVKLNRMESRNFNDAVVSFFNKFDMDPAVRDYIEDDNGSLDNNRIKQLTSWCLYGAGAGVHPQEH
ncbi:KICSTOR complex protein ITFG2-like isoform X2 [Dendronephthya gigantea]|uniref:KICSTOR complex protein ITFG2-like isoform X2 n=1 Tax=Dendronephthya gigantea TaxID=151771 RepID=UPI00106A7850|nr:KICSTOR complex protein ITFG2-like isoform X2 [Dendronephthya gigantea]